MPTNLEAKPTVPETSSTPKEQLEELKKSADKGSWNIFEKFKEFFTNLKEKGLVETFFGPLLGFLYALKKPESPGGTKEPEPQKTAEAFREPDVTLNQLDQLAQRIDLANLDHTKLRSEKYDTVTSKDKETDKERTITLCSGTALRNLYKLGCRHIFSAATAVEDMKKNPNHNWEGLPQGDAYMVRSFYSMSKVHNKIPGGKNSKENKNLIPYLDASGIHVADVLVDSRSEYNHRAVAFKSSSDRLHRWYILDPYMHGESFKIPKLNEKILQLKKQIEEAGRMKQDEKIPALKADKEAAEIELGVVMENVKEPILLEQYMGNIEYVVPLKQDAEPALAYIPPKTPSGRS